MASSQLYQQFGTDPAKASDKRIVKIFRRQVLRELKKIKLAWPGLNYGTAPGDSPLTWANSFIWLSKFSICFLNCSAVKSGSE